VVTTLRLLLVVVLTALVGLADVGCRARAPGEQVVRVGYVPNLTQAQVLLGLASGEYARAALPARLEARAFGAGPSLVEALFAGEVDVGYVGPAPVLAAHAQSKGRALRVIAGAAANGVVVVARKDAGIANLRDLAGKRLATPQLGNSQDLSARHFLRAELGQRDLGSVLPYATAEHASLLARGQVDASWVVEPWATRLVDESGAVVVAEERDLWPGRRFTQSLVVASTEVLREHPDVVERLLAAHHAWTERLKREPARHVPALGDALFAATGKRLSPGILERAITRVEFTDDPLEETLRTMARWSNEVGLSRAVADPTNLVDLTLLGKVTP
jgi:NitT/TauT family transport system substrate-binding protein